MLPWRWLYEINSVSVIWLLAKNFILPTLPDLSYPIFLTDSVHGFPLVWSDLFFFIVIVIRPISLICLSDSVHSAANSGTRSIDICHTASVSGTMKLVFHRKLGSAEDMEHQFHSAADSGGMAKIYRHSAAVSVEMDRIS